MAAALTVTPASGEVIEVESAVRVDVTGGDNTVRQRISATLAGQDTLRSHEFEPSSDGKHTWPNVIFPVDGTWTLTLYATEDDSTLATLSVVVV
jgi:hypothetical protein